MLRQVIKSSALVLLLLEAGCTPKIESRTRDATAAGETDGAAVDELAGTVTDGAVSASASASATNTQQIAGVGGADGSVIAFPPGSLAIDTTLTVEEGEDLSGSAAELGISSSDVTSASPSVIVGSSESVDPVSPFTVSLPLSGAALALQEDPYAKLVILHKRQEYTANRTVVGVLLRAAITISDGKVTFQTGHFGVFQAVYTATQVTEELSAVTTNPIVNKTESLVPLTISFSTTSPASPSTSTSFAISGAVDSAATSVILYSDAKCTTQLASGSKTDFEGSGISVTISANKSVEIYGLTNGTSRPSSSCTKLTTVVTDTSAPSAPTVSATSSASDTTPTWTWTKPDGASGVFRYKLDSSVLTTGATEGNALTYTAATALSDGTHTLYVQARDLAGNWSSSGSAAATIDTTDPTLVVTAPTLNEYVPAKTFLVEGTCEAGLGIAIAGTNITTTSTTCPSGTFQVNVEHSIDVAIAAVPITVYLTQTDAAGNTTSVAATHNYGFDTANLQFWLDDTVTSLAISGSTVISWTDKSTGPTSSLTAGTITKGLMNARPVATFAGTESISYSASKLDNVAPVAQDMSIFVAFEVATGAGGYLFAKGDAGTPNSIAYALGIESSDNSINLVLGGVSYPSITSAANDGTVRILSIQSNADATAPMVKIYDTYNDTPVTSSVTQGSQDGGSYPLKIGDKAINNAVGSGTEFSGKIGEIMIFHRLVSSAERARIHAYLKQKWRPSP